MVVPDSLFSLQALLEDHGSLYVADNGKIKCVLSIVVPRSCICKSIATYKTITRYLEPVFLCQPKMEEDFKFEESFHMTLTSLCSVGIN